MRKQVSLWLETYLTQEMKAVLLTGDLGFMAFERIQKAIGERFINAGVAEQNMISIAAALAFEGLSPICYSIAPFAVFRPAEQIRLDVCLHNLNVKIIGNGGGYGYGIMGATHHALEDLGHLTSYQNMSCYIPFCDEDVAQTCDSMMSRKGPGYLRLGAGSLPNGLTLTPFAPIRSVKKGSSDSRWTIVGIGPCLLNASEADADIFAASQLPLTELTDELKVSILRTGQLLVLEEHVEKSGLAEHLALHLLKQQILPRRFETRTAVGYPDGRYGSQNFHRQKSGLDAESILGLVRKGA